MDYQSTQPVVRVRRWLCRGRGCWRTFTVVWRQWFDRLFVCRICNSVADANGLTVCFELGDCESSHVAYFVIGIAYRDSELVDERNGLFDALSYINNEYDGQRFPYSQQLGNADGYSIGEQNTDIKRDIYVLAVANGKLVWDGFNVRHCIADD